MRTCSKCVLDETDPLITFDENGICNHCHRYDEMVDKYVVQGSLGFLKMSGIASEIKEKGKNKNYDCVIGLSGGVDSAYALYRAIDTFGLRPLAVHIDNGWNTALSVSNVNKMVREFNIDLHTHVIDWEEFKDVQLSFLKAGVPDLEIPSDLAINSYLLKFAHSQGIDCIIQGGNIRTESHIPKAWSQGHRDWKYVQSIHKEYGSVPIKTLPHMTLLEYAYLYKRVRQVFILNYLDYNKQQALQELKHRLNFFEYEGKHCESSYTRFYQRFMLPIRFDYDKRKSHLSSLICSGQISREDALEILKKKPWDYEELASDLVFVMKKLSLPEDAYVDLMSLPKNSYNDFLNYEKVLNTWWGKIFYGYIFRDRMKIL